MADWTIVKIGGREYVTVQNLKDFYRTHFTTMQRKGALVTFASKQFVMRLRVGSQECYINNVKFMLSLPVAEDGGRVVVSRLDLSKLIDPVLRPTHIATAQIFDTVVVDPGHGGHDTGAKGVFGYEKNYTLDVGLRVGRLLQAQGFKVRMTRTADTYPSLGERVTMANSTPNSIFVSIHFNDGGSSAEGVETYALAPQGTTRSRKEGNTNDGAYFSGNERDSENIALATAIHAQLLMQLRPIDRGIMRDRWFVLKGIERPGVLVEGGFISSPAEGARIHDVSYRTRMANSIYQGIVNFRAALLQNRRPAGS